MNRATACETRLSISFSQKRRGRNSKRRHSSLQTGCGGRATMCSPRGKTPKLHERRAMNHGLTPATAGDRLGLADLPEIRDLLLRAGFFSFRVASWCMYPTLWKGGALAVGPTFAI